MMSPAVAGDNRNVDSRSRIRIGQGKTDSGLSVSLLGGKVIRSIRRQPDPRPRLAAIGHDTRSPSFVTSVMPWSLPEAMSAYVGFPRYLVGSPAGCSSNSCQDARPLLLSQWIQGRARRLRSSNRFARHPIRGGRTAALDQSSVPHSHPTGSLTALLEFVRRHDDRLIVAVSRTVTDRTEDP